MQKNTLKNKLTKWLFALLAIMFMLGMIGWTSLGAATQVDDEMTQHFNSAEHAEPFIENGYYIPANISPSEVDDFAVSNDVSVETIDLYAQGRYPIGDLDLLDMEAMSVTGATLRIDPTTTQLNVSAAGHIHTVTATTSSGWWNIGGWWELATNRPQWVFFSYNWGQSGTSRSIYVLRNTTPAPRSATVTITASGAPSVTISINQAAGGGAAAQLLGPRRVDLGAVQFDVAGAIHWNSRSPQNVNIRSLSGSVSNRSGISWPQINRLLFAVHDARFNNHTRFPASFSYLQAGGTVREEIPWSQIFGNTVFQKNDFVYANISFGTANAMGGFGIFMFSDRDYVDFLN